MGNPQVQGSPARAWGYFTAASRSGPVLNPNLLLIDVIFGMDCTAALETLQERPETLDIPFFFNKPKVQSHEIKVLETIGAVDAIVNRFVYGMLPDRVGMAQAGEHG